MHTTRASGRRDRPRKRRAGCCVRSACAACALGTPQRAGAVEGLGSRSTSPATALRTCAHRTPSCQSMDDACSAVVRTRSGYAHMRTQTGVVWGALGRCVFRIQPGCVCGGQAAGRESALWHAHLRTRCARAHMRSACYTRAPHTHTHGADCRLQNRRSQAVKTMFGKPRKRWYRESSILCARADAVVRESAPYAHMRTRCADAQMRKCTAHARTCAAPATHVPPTRTHTVQIADCRTVAHRR